VSFVWLNKAAKSGVDVREDRRVFMVQDAIGELDYRLVISPNRSLSWRQSMWFVAAVAVFLLAISAVFAVRGFWLIFPFAGIEVLLLAYATHRVVYASYRCQVVSIDTSQVVVEKGHQRGVDSPRGGPETSASLPRAWVRVELEKRVSWYPRRLLLSASGNHVELGEFLTDDEKKTLAGELKRLLAKK
jgi:uncharacterized membrane protein